MATVRDLQLTLDQPSEGDPPSVGLGIGVRVTGTIEFTEQEVSDGDEFRVRIDLLPAHRALAGLLDLAPLFTFSFGSRLFWLLRRRYYVVRAQTDPLDIDRSIVIDPEKLDSDPRTHTEQGTIDILGETTEVEFEADNDDPIVARVLLSKEARSNVETVIDRRKRLKI
jgi:hypothetical protein